MLNNSAQNYGIRQINAGNTAFLAELFNNYKTLLQTGLIYDGAFLTQADYRNTITAGLRMKEYAWVEAFIHGQKQHLDPRHRNNTFSYNLANFYYQTGAPARAKRLLQSVEFTDVFYGLNARAILVQVYYEDEDDDALLDLLRAFKAYLERHRKALNYQYELYNNLIRAAKKLQRLRVGKPLRASSPWKGKVQQFQQELAGQKVNRGGWLGKQLELLVAG